MKSLIVRHIKYMIYLLIQTSLSLAGHSQEFKKSRLVTAADTILQIRVFRANTIITGYSGDSIILEVNHRSDKTNLVPAGLKKISDDNGNDSVIVRFGSDIDVDGTGSNSEVLIKLPKNLPVRVQCYTEAPGDSLKIIGLNCLAEIMGEVNEIIVKNSSIPFRTNVRSAKIELINSFTIDRSALLPSVSSWYPNCSFLNSGEIKISIAEQTNLLLDISSITGLVFSDLKGLHRSGKQVIPSGRQLPRTIYQGVLNNGNEKLFIKTTFGNISLKSVEGEKDNLYSLYSPELKTQK